MDGRGSRTALGRVPEIRPSLFERPNEKLAVQEWGGGQRGKWREAFYSTGGCFTAKLTENVAMCCRDDKMIWKIKVQVNKSS